MKGALWSNRRLVICGGAVLLLGCTKHVRAQQSSSPEQELQRLSSAIEQAQARVDASQQQLLELKRDLAALRQQLGQTASASSARTLLSVTEETAVPADQSEREAMQESQIATLNQVKVESRSKYPVTINGLILLNSFINSSGVDITGTPAVALGGGGTAGASLRQTSFGVDARGPGFAGATSGADFEVDFLGNAAQPINADVGGLVRLRTAHAYLNWKHTHAFFQLDRLILNPNAPTSLVAIAQPALAWSGNLWQWVPQAGVSQSVALGARRRLEFGAALVDAPDPPALSTSSTSSASNAEHSRSPGGEVRLGLADAGTPGRTAAGVGVYFSPHRIPASSSYNAWAVTVDGRLPLPAGFAFTGSAYRGAALGGLGGGAYKDFVSRQGVTGVVVSRPLDDVGGWAQLKKRAGERLEFNAAVGIDEVFAKELRAYPLNDATVYKSLARNRTISGNTIWSPSAYLLFSFEYRRISSYSIAAPVANSNIFGIAAGYKF